MSNRPESPSARGAAAAVAAAAVRPRPMGLRAGPHWLIIALASFAICFCALAVGRHSTGPPEVVPATGTEDGTRPGSGGGGTAHEGAVASSDTGDVLPLVIAGVSGLGGFLSGVAALITARQGARQRQPAPDCADEGHPPECHRLARSRVHR
ncbi:hypothetical protein [Streptomyces sp. NPDC058964]|uniref:hypothetical protein n=1 Tax=Streptomyces sp. NPDC058964 TaxID=3346681 RepID=UPI0036901E0D